MDGDLQRLNKWHEAQKAEFESKLNSTQNESSRQIRELESQVNTYRKENEGLCKKHKHDTN